MDLARRLKGRAELRDKTARQVMVYFDRWWNLSYRLVRTQPRIASVQAFKRAWERVKYPYGERLAAALTLSGEITLPPAIADAVEHHEGLIRLASILIALQLKCSLAEQPFFLSCKKAGELLEVDRKTAHGWLRVFEELGWLTVVERGEAGTLGGKATRYRWTGPRPPSPY